MAPSIFRKTNYPAIAPPPSTFSLRIGVAGNYVGNAAGGAARPKLETYH
jgi:hypothetical protein